MDKRYNEMESKRIRQPNLLRMFVICFLAVGAFFFGYEIIESTLLQGAHPEVIHILHLIRGCSAAAIASVLATLIILRQTHDSSSDVILSPSEKSWKRRLQNMPLRVKVAVPMVVLAILPALTIGIFTIVRMQKSLRESAVQRLEFDATSKAKALQSFLQAVQKDLRFLSNIKAIRELATAESKELKGQISRLRQEVEQEFLVFSQGKRAYYQVRYLNNAGHEVLRLNVKIGSPTFVPSEQLQDKGNRYYVKATRSLEAEQVYVSPMDLNVEHGKVETPSRRVVRYATRVAGVEEVGQGFLIINVYADYLLSLIGPLAPETEAWLVGQNGCYLGYIGTSEKRHSLFLLEKERHVSEDYAQEEVQTILGHGDGVFSVKTDNAFISGSHIFYDPQNSSRHWTLLISHPQAPIEAPIRHLTTFLLLVMTFVVAVAAILGILIGEYLARPIVQLQRATRTIASGNLEKRLYITTGDEIERLANDFNTMTSQLRDARDQLSSWNLELESKVVQQTGILQGMQQGMARVDKLASIGQITAGVMHEVGNPLAAIKTKIQVAEEDESLCDECRELLTEIIREVDRLAVFLHSFSRLSRLSGRQAKKKISLPEVANRVVALVSANLRSRGVALRCEIADNIPLIHGVADQLGQVLMNLILNAADASSDGGEVVVRIQSSAQESISADTDGTVSLQVVDQGEGISSEVLVKVWDPFFTTKQEGTGLGLAICRQIVEDHCGSIRIDSDVGKGTVVTVILSDLLLGVQESHEDTIKQ